MVDFICRYVHWLLLVDSKRAEEGLELGVRHQGKPSHLQSYADIHKPAEIMSCAIPLARVKEHSLTYKMYVI